MHVRTGRGNRLGLAVVGLLLLLGGVALVLANRGVFGSKTADGPLYPVAARRFIHDQGNWLWLVVLAAAIVIGLVFLRWLLVQFRRDRLRSVLVDADDPDANGSGRTTLDASALIDAVAGDLEAVHAVRRAKVSVAGRRDAPELWIDLTTTLDVSVQDLTRYLHEQVGPQVALALDRTVPIQVTVVPTSRESAREVA